MTFGTVPLPRVSFHVPETSGTNVSPAAKTGKKREFLGKLRLLLLWMIPGACVAIQAPVFRLNPERLHGTHAGERHLPSSRTAESKYHRPTIAQLSQTKSCG